MAFSADWEAQYSASRNMSIWPWSDLVSLVKRHAKHLTEGAKVFEVGCGAGANIPFFLSLGVDYYSVEGSATAVNGLIDRYPHLKQKIVAGDFTADLPFDFLFSAIIDRSSLTHNSHDSILATLDTFYDSLVPGGVFIGVDWFSTEHKEFALAPDKLDDYTRQGWSTGQFVDVGPVHFSDENCMRKMFGRFELIHLQHKVFDTLEPLDSGRFASWNIVARKPL